jgi:hypothetical protein
MPDVRNPDPFKPIQPRIPGVPSTAEKETAAPEQQPEPMLPQYRAARRDSHEDSPGLWIALAAIAALVTLGGLFYWSRSSSSSNSKAKQIVSTETVAQAAAPSAPTKADPAGALPVAPGPVATTAELAKAWSAKRFVYRDPLTSRFTPALVVRLPGGQYWGLLMQEPYGDCQLDYVTDLKQLRESYGFAADHPMVVNPCNRTVYDLARYGAGAANGGLARGEIVQGTGIRPPIAIEMRTSGKDVVAVRSE